MNEIRIKSCTCIQCKYVKNKRKHRKYKKKIKRILNKKRRKAKFGEMFTYYWA